MNAARILVVDDEPQIRRVLRSTLSTHGYEIAEAKTGEEALEWMRKGQPDLVLLDMNMAGMGGVEACREIRRASDAPIIMLTVRNAERDKVAALDAGADDLCRQTVWHRRIAGAHSCRAAPVCPSRRPSAICLERLEY